jgi:hypothetical protein
MLKLNGSTEELPGAIRNVKVDGADWGHHDKRNHVSSSKNCSIVCANLSRET